jgi:hypothetical protein
MPVILREVSVGANSVDPNLIAGSTYELQRGNVYMSIGVAAAATGIFITILSGSDVVLERSAAPILTRYPIIPDEMYFTDVATVADRLVILAENTTGGALVVRAVVQITNI